MSNFQAEYCLLCGLLRPHNSHLWELQQALMGNVPGEPSRARSPSDGSPAGVHPGWEGNWFIPPPGLLSHMGHCCGEAQGYNMETA